MPLAVEMSDQADVLGDIKSFVRADCLYCGSKVVLFLGYPSGSPIWPRKVDFFVRKESFLM